IWSNNTYDKFASLYDIILGLFLPKKYRRVVVDYLTSGNVLDVACGTGDLLLHANKKGLKCYGIDLSMGMIKQASKKVPDVELREGNYYKIPYDNNMFDNVVSTYALGGTKINIEKVLQEMIRVCKPNGQIVILDWQKKQKENLLDKLFIGIAKLTEDTPKDFIGIFTKHGMKTDWIKLSQTYSIIKTKKIANE
ncbi:MAG: methyltransferase domain-containing protein, partial [Candidatus Delongbacteria bacterium]|nr:methyltransferase domain-containing protein [Candidatus Delongbacteria bacterium]